MDRPRTITPSPKSVLRDVVFTDPPKPVPSPQLPAVAELKPPAPAATAKIYPAAIARAILAVTREIGHIAKQGKNEFQGYQYARWDDIVEKLSPLLADHGLILVQTEKSRHLIEENDKGSTLSIVYGFAFINEDGDTWPEIEWTALARLRDQKGLTDDKAAAKCHTQAEKYFCIKQFKIRTGEAIDSDADGAEHGSQRRHATLPKKNARDIYTKLETSFNAIADIAALRRWGEEKPSASRCCPRTGRISCACATASAWSSCASIRASPSTMPTA